jgi:GrpB-like predicted nucleotidyltransferase (UPF0157 family)
VRAAAPGAPELWHRANATGGGGARHPTYGHRVPVKVVPYSPDWPVRFAQVATILRTALADVPSAAVEHVGSSIPGLAKPIIDIDVVVDADDLPAAIAALETLGYVHRGDLGVTDREAFNAPDEEPRRHVYVCRRGTLNVRNHLAVRAVLQSRPDLRDEYGAVKTALASDPEMDIDTYVACKSQSFRRSWLSATLRQKSGSRFCG